MECNPGWIFEIQVAEQMTKHSLVFPPQNVSKVVDTTERKYRGRSGAIDPSPNAQRGLFRAQGISLPAAIVINQCEGVFMWIGGHALAMMGSATKRLVVQTNR